ncbi:Dabb family protein [Thalassospira marina]|uniref:Stress responsive protein n=1 Tax=Thalassospira marina TaxID=2048283 RepID=A0A2N3KVT8_9PROT|nr:Dabb family protein [Thalassospira marina]AUG54684.1 stress responsive protein [Thalassospira marina]PKR54692.1 stress responsive protein [Thalassospira marina]
MIRHIVLVQVPYHADPAERDAVFAALKDIALKTKGMLAFSGGRSLEKDGLHQGFTHAFTIDFVDAGARNEYLSGLDQNHTGHRLIKLAQGGLGGILVMNIELDPAPPAGPERPRKLQASWG